MKQLQDITPERRRRGWWRTGPVLASTSGRKFLTRPCLAAMPLIYDTGKGPHASVLSPLTSATAPAAAAASRAGLGRLPRQMVSLWLWHQWQAQSSRLMSPVPADLWGFGFANQQLDGPPQLSQPLLKAPAGWRGTERQHLRRQF